MRIKRLKLRLLNRQDPTQDVPGVAKHFSCLVVIRDMVIVNNAISNLENSFGLLNPGARHPQGDCGIPDEFGESGPRRSRFRAEGGQDSGMIPIHHSGLKAITHSDGKPTTPEGWPA